MVPELANTPASSSKQAAQATPKGLRSLQRSTGPFADRSLCLLCAGDAENANQPTFSVEPQIDAKMWDINTKKAY